MEVKINKDIREYTESIVLGLSWLCVKSGG